MLHISFKTAFPWKIRSVRAMEVILRDEKDKAAAEQCVGSLVLG
jgi:hypothetical protein